MENTSVAEYVHEKRATKHSIHVLLIDDQIIIGEAVKRLLQDEKDIIFDYCSNPSDALILAEKIHPTVILLDLIMPDIDGLTLLKQFRSQENMKDIPIIVLSTKEDPNIKAEAFSLGANDYLVKIPDRIELIARIRYHSKSYIHLLERNEVFRYLKESQKILTDELSEAAQYVKSLLPEPLKKPFEIDWKFIPSTQLGGDAFGYHWLDKTHFAIYLLDVCGHGVGAALLSISIVNLLRSQTLPETNFIDPSSVLTALNHAFPMESQNNMFFTIWYGVYNSETFELNFSSGGHPPALLFQNDTQEKMELISLTTNGIAIGVDLDSHYENKSCVIKKHNTLYLFSDGVYEIHDSNGVLQNIAMLSQLISDGMDSSQPQSLEDIISAIREMQRKNLFDDDVSILKVKFFRHNRD